MLVGCSGASAAAAPGAYGLRWACMPSFDFGETFLYSVPDSGVCFQGIFPMPRLPGQLG